MPYYYAVYNIYDPDPSIADLTNLSSAWSTAFAIAHGTWEDTAGNNGYIYPYTYVGPDNDLYRYAIIFSELGYESLLSISHPHNYDKNIMQWTPYMDTLGVIAHWQLNERDFGSVRCPTNWTGGGDLDVILRTFLQAVKDTSGDPDTELYYTSDYHRFRVDHITGTDTDFNVRHKDLLSGDFDIYTKFESFSGLTGSEIFFGIESVDEDWNAEIGAIDIGDDFEWTISHSSSNNIFNRSSTYFYFRIQRVGTTIKLYVFDGAGTDDEPGTWVEKASNTNATYNEDDLRLYVNLKIGSAESSGSKYLPMVYIKEYVAPVAQKPYLISDRIGNAFGYIKGAPIRGVNSLITNDHRKHMTLDGSADYFDLTVSRTILENAIFSIIGTFKTSYTTTAQTLMSACPEGSETNGRGWKIGINAAGNLTFDYGDGLGTWQTQLVSTTASFNNGIGHNFVLVFGGNGNAITLYIDGTAEIASTAAVAIQYTDNGSGNLAFFGIGAEINSSNAMINYFNGILGDFALTGDVITAIEASDIDDDFNGI